MSNVEQKLSKTRAQLRIGIVIQARSGSTRFPEKVLKTISGKTVLTRVLDQCKKVRSISTIVVATTTKAADDVIERLAESQGAEVFRGSEADVLSRYAESARKYALDWIVRVTSDCPLLDPNLVDQLIEKAISEDLDFVSISTKPGGEIARSFPHGLDAEVYRREALLISDQEVTDPLEKEHVGVFITKNSNRFRIGILQNSEDLSFVRVTLDYPEDLERLNFIAENLSADFRWPEIVDLVREKRPPLFFIVDSENRSGNGHIVRSQSLARALARKGQDCVFITQEPSKILPLFEPLPLKGHSGSEKADQVAKLMRSVNSKLLVVDSYLLPNLFYETLKNKSPTTKIIAFDDAGEKQNVPADKLICLYSENSQKSLAVGLKYFPLREEINEIIELKDALSGDHKTIFVCMGGADQNGYTEKVGHALKQIPEAQNYEVHLVYGPHTTKKEVNWPLNFKIFQNPKNFIELLRRSSLSIISAGNLAWEALALGKSSAVVQTVGNQLRSIQMIKKNKAAFVLENNELVFVKGIESFLQNESLRNEFQKNASEMIDGQGAERLANVIIEFGRVELNQGG